MDLEIGKLESDLAEIEDRLKNELDLKEAQKLGRMAQIDFDKYKYDKDSAEARVKQMDSHINLSKETLASNKKDAWTFKERYEVAHRKLEHEKKIDKERLSRQIKYYEEEVINQKKQIFETT